MSFLQTGDPTLLVSDEDHVLFFGSVFPQEIRFCQGTWSVSGTASSSEVPGTGQRRDGDWDGFWEVI